MQGEEHMSRTPEYLAADLELWADRIADGHIFHTPDEFNCAAVMRLAAMMLKSPQQRTWVGLTDEEAQWLYDNCRTSASLIDMTEAKLKKKNDPNGT
jgi:hypothetical protein